jgi:hypothetical protein
VTQAYCGLGNAFSPHRDSRDSLCDMVWWGRNRRPTTVVISCVRYGDRIINCLTATTWVDDLMHGVIHLAFLINAHPIPAYPSRPLWNGEHVHTIFSFGRCRLPIDLHVSTGPASPAIHSSFFVVSGCGGSRAYPHQTLGCMPCFS